MGKEQIQEIVEIQLGDIRKRLMERKLNLKLSDGAEELIAERGFDPEYGARPLKRALQRMMLDPLAKRLLQGEFREGDIIEVTRQNGNIVFEKTAQE